MITSGIWLGVLLFALKMGAGVKMSWWVIGLPLLVAVSVTGAVYRARAQRRGH